MKRIIISEDERKRILGMHEDATKRHYGLVKEQGDKTEPGGRYTNDDGVVYQWSAITDEQSLIKFIDFLTDYTNHYGKESWQKLNDKGINIVKDIYSALGIPSWEEILNTGFSKSHPYYQLMRAYFYGLNKVARLGRLLKPEDITEDIKGQLTDNRVKTISNYTLAKHINALAKNSQIKNFPDYPLS